MQRGCNGGSERPSAILHTGELGCDVKISTGGENRVTWNWFHCEMRGPGNRASHITAALLYCRMGNGVSYAKGCLEIQGTCAGGVP